MGVPPRGSVFKSEVRNFETDSDAFRRTVGLLCGMARMAGMAHLMGKSPLHPMHRRWIRCFFNRPEGRPDPQVAWSYVVSYVTTLASFFLVFLMLFWSWAWSGCLTHPSSWTAGHKKGFINTPRRVFHQRKSKWLEKDVDSRSKHEDLQYNKQDWKEFPNANKLDGKDISQDGEVHLVLVLIKVLAWAHPLEGKGWERMGQAVWKRSIPLSPL